MSTPTQPRFVYRLKTVPKNLSATAPPPASTASTPHPASTPPPAPAPIEYADYSALPHWGFIVADPDQRAPDDFASQDTAELCRKCPKVAQYVSNVEIRANERKAAYNASRANRPTTMNWGCTCASFDCVRKLTESHVSNATGAEIVRFLSTKKLLFSKQLHLHHHDEHGTVRAEMRKTDDSYVCPWPNCERAISGPFLALMQASPPSNKSLHRRMKDLTRIPTRQSTLLLSRSAGTKSSRQWVATTARDVLYPRRLRRIRSNTRKHQ